MPAEKKVTSVLIVDDSPESRRLIRRILQSQGDFHIYEADNGQAGLAEELFDRQRAAARQGHPPPGQGHP